MNTERFFEEIRKNVFKKGLTQSQVEGIEAILRACQTEKVTDEEIVAYILATAHWETGAKMQPVREIGKGKGRKYGVPGKHNGQVAYGRGLVQLTWDRNYEKADEELGLGGRLIENYDLALDPEISARILVRGSMEGWFTNKDLVDYLGEGEDWINARRVVNGKDKAETIAQLAMKYDKALEVAGGWMGLSSVGKVVKRTPGIAEQPEITDKSTVRRVQEALRALGYPEVGFIDGLMGDRTRAGISAFEINEGLPPTGRLTNDLLTRIMKADSRKVSVTRKNLKVRDISDSPGVKIGQGIKVVGGIGAIFGGGGGILDAISEDNGQIGQTIDNTMTTVTRFNGIANTIMDIGPWVALVVFGLIVIGGGYLFIQHLLQGSREGRHV